MTHLSTLVQLAMAAAIVYLFGVEGPAFLRVFLLAVAGFAVNLMLPMRLRLPFFVLLSLAGIFLVFSPADGLWLLAGGLLLIGCCHLPFGFWPRVALLTVIGTALALARGIETMPWSMAVWPILGSMFMFRLALYMLAPPKEQLDRKPWWSLAYFFMLPNLVFPLFPVVDYATFRRTYYDKEESAIYAQGVLWIARGLMHLLLYRVVYHAVLNDPTDVITLGDLVQYMVGTFLLYLRVSGQFHLIVGVLHLFGFRLPETHKLYYLAHSFTELWRRINIYWTDFMMKTVFYPSYFRFKKLGPTAALGWATTAVFVVTWVLHAYQWFWLRGGFPITIQDTLFWGILGALVVRGALKELKEGKKPRQGVTGWSWRLGLKAATTFTAFCFLWSLWSATDIDQWLFMLGSAVNVDLKGVVLSSTVFLAIFVLGGRDWEAAGASQQAGWWRFATAPAMRSFAALAVLLIAALPQVLVATPPPVARGLHAMKTTGLNARDAALQHRGYYEQLDIREQLNGAVPDRVAVRGEQWEDLSAIGVLRERQDILVRDLQPSRHATWNGNSFTTNRWGMRDQDYDKTKPPGTLRIALLGPSHVMGNGVGDAETFERLVEERLNREFKDSRYQRYEILNFGVDGYNLTQQIAMLEDRVLDFDPDVVIATHYQRNRTMTERYLLKLTWGGIDIPYPAVQDALRRAGLWPIEQGNVAVPSAAGRALAKMVGLQPRMPEGESEARVRWVADEVLGWSFRRFAEVTSAHGIVPLVLALNVVIDDVPAEIPLRHEIETAGLPVIDLFDIFPEADRPSLRVAPWDDHPNAVGHRLIADALYRQIADRIASGELSARPLRTAAQTTGGNH